MKPRQSQENRYNPETTPGSKPSAGLGGANPTYPGRPGGNPFSPSKPPSGPGSAGDPAPGAAKL